MQRLQEDWNYEFRATPIEYPISDNDRKATYDQFMSLRDTMVYSNKFYGNNAWRSLIVWMKSDGNPTNTIEIRSPNSVRLAFEPWYESNPSLVTDTTQWWYVSRWTTYSSNLLTCTINMTWRYKIYHKEQFVNIDSDITRIKTYALQYHQEGNHWITTERAVFDLEWNTAWEMIRVPAYGYVECDLSKWDWLELRMEDQNWSPISSSSWQLQTNSNWRSVEYLDLAYNL